ncbi:hypothetical protein H8356DRAFT_1323626 [Neocallimastix lanati (nom. inval.)]|nr:hypothetical protein H8356DRAFT_1323626 [Neocallimastix sp. JGI-2020a]
MSEIFKQHDNPQPQKLMDRLQQEFKSERTLEEDSAAHLRNEKIADNAATFYDLPAEKQTLDCYIELQPKAKDSQYENTQRIFEAKRREEQL